MSKAVSSPSVFFLTITIQPQREGLDVPPLISKISDILVDHQNATKILHKFKVSGDAKVLVYIQVSDIGEFERIVASLWQLGPIDVDSQPVICYENFAQNMNVAKELCEPFSCLQREGVYWIEVSIEYHGKAFDDFLALWKKEAETVLSIRQKGETNIELFKTLGQRIVHLLINASDSAQLDLLTFQLPIMVENGANIQVKSKNVQYLEDYTARFVK